MKKAALRAIFYFKRRFAAPYPTSHQPLTTSHQRRAAAHQRSLHRGLSSAEGKADRQSCETALRQRSKRNRGLGLGAGEFGIQNSELDNCRGIPKHKEPITL